MPAIGTTQNSMMPSIGQILDAVNPKNMVAGLAVISGISNISAAPARHGGNLGTEAHARWDDNGARQMQACLSLPAVHRLDPDRAAIDCMLQTMKTWIRESDDPNAATVVSRGVRRYGLGSSPVAPTEGEMPGAPDKALREARNNAWKSDEYLQTLARAESYFWLYSLTPDSQDPGQPYTADALKQALNNKAGGLHSFKDNARHLSFKLNKLLMEERKSIYALKPELLPSPTDLEAFEKEVNKFFAATPTAPLNDHQFTMILIRLASYMNKKSSPG